MTTIRPMTATDHTRLLTTWHESVKATHFFLTTSDIEFFHPLVDEMLSSGALKIDVLVDDNDSPIGWLGMDGNKIEALFLDPAVIRKGHGRTLVQHAIEQHDELTVDVNEQNPEAVKFYEAMGFVVEDRSPLDGMGNPFPLLHMRRNSSV